MSLGSAAEGGLRVFQIDSNDVSLRSLETSGPLVPGPSTPRSNEHLVTDSDADPDRYAVLRLECIGAKTLKVCRWTCF